MSRRAVAGLVVIAAALTGCSGSSGGGTRAAASSASPSAASPSASPSPSPSPSPTAAASPSAAAVAPALILEGDGLGVLVGGSSIRQLPFETTTATQITTVLDRVLGPGRSVALPECGQGPRRSYQAKGFSVLLDGSKFVGWFDEGAPGRSLTSADGVGIGITLARLRALRPNVQVTSDTLGPEFGQEPTDISGFLSGTNDASKVTKVYAGETCFFR